MSDQERKLLMAVAENLKALMEARAQGRTIFRAEYEERLADLNSALKPLLEGKPNGQGDSAGASA